MRVLVRVDGSPRMGGGHALRCLTLANALARRGAQVQFVCAQMIPAAAERILRAGHRLRMIAPPASATADRDDWDLALHADADQRLDAERTRAVADGEPDWIVIDHYGLDRRWQAAARGGARIAVIDDLANRPHDCDLLLDQNFGRNEADYRALVPDSCRILAGPRFALLRPEFAEARAAALERRNRDGPARRLLVSLGSTDVGGITGRVLREIVAANLALAIDVVLGSAAPSFDKVCDLAATHPNVTVHSDPDSLAELMVAADLAIGAAGTTSWERCCLGLPTLCLALAANQRRAAEELERAGVHRLVRADEPDALRAALRELAEDETARRELAAKSTEVCDGLGADRTLGHFLSERHDR